MNSDNYPLCSICCVGYKHQKYIEDCINSIWRNHYPNIEIIALDDGSEDGSLEKLKKLQTLSPCPFKILEQARTANVGKNLNRVFFASQGEFIHFLSMDDMLLPDSIESKMDILLKDGKCAFVANLMSLKMDKNGLSKNVTPINYVNSFDISTLLEMERAVFHTFYVQCAIFRREIIEKIHAFNENMIGDDIVLRTKLFLFLQKNPQYTYYFLSSPGVIYREHDEAAHKNMQRQMNIVLQYHEKFWPQYPLSSTAKQWLLYAISELDFSEALKIFTFSHRATDYFMDADVVQALSISGAKKYLADSKE